MNELDALLNQMADTLMSDLKRIVAMVAKVVAEVKALLVKMRLSEEKVAELLASFRESDEVRELKNELETE